MTRLQPSRGRSLRGWLTAVTIACIALPIGAVRAGFVPLDTGAIQALRATREERPQQGAVASTYELPGVAYGLKRSPPGPDGRVRLVKLRRPRKDHERFDHPKDWVNLYLRERRNAAGRVPIEKLALAREHARRMPGGALGKREAPAMVRPVEELERGLPAGSRIVTLSEQVAARSPGKTVGPVAELNGWTSLGPGNIGGRTRGLLAVTDDLLYAAGVAGGVWKSEDGGESWVVLDDTMGNLAVASLAFDPASPTTLYAGTGEGFFNGDFVQGDGIFKSTDGGATWTQLASTAGNSSFHFVNAIGVSTLAGSTVYAATNSGFFRSTDGGVSWTEKGGFTDRVTDMAVTPIEGTDAVAVWVSEDGFHLSLDGGQTFQRRSSGLPDAVRTSIGVSAGGARIYLLCGDFSADRGIFTSTDLGVTWTRVADPEGSGFDGDFGGQLWYDNVCRVDPTDPLRVWVGGINLFVSSDGGQSWTQASRWCASPGDPKDVHADQHAITFAPGYDGAANQRIYFGTDGGVYVSDNGAAAAPTFRNLNNGYGVTQFYHGAVSATGTILIGGTQDNGTIRFDAGSGSSDWKRIFPGDGFYVAIDPGNPEIHFVESQFGNIHKTTQASTCGTPDCFVPSCYSDAGSGLTEFFPFSTIYAMDPANSSRLWLGGEQVWRTVDGASSWTSVTGGAALEDFSGFKADITAIMIAPSGGGNVVYAGTSFGSVFRTTNGLSASPTWTKISSGLPTSSFPSASWIDVHPSDPDRAFLTYSSFDVPGGQVWKTTDGGSSWQAAKGVGNESIPNIPCHSVIHHPDDPDRIFVGTELGVFASDDSGETWNNVNNPGLANTVVETLVIQKSSGRLFAFTHGRGVFAADTAIDAGLTITSIAASSALVAAGSTFSTTVAVRNSGAEAVDVTAGSLVVSSSILSPGSLANASSIAPGATSSFTFSVQAVSKGVASITSAVFTAVSGSTPVPVKANQASPVAVTVVDPADLVELRLESLLASVSSVSVDQSFVATARIRNDGVASARISKAKLLFSSGLLTAPELTNTVTVPGSGGSVELSFTVTPNAIGVSSITSVALTAVEADSGTAVPLAANEATPIPITISPKPGTTDLRLVGLAVSRDRIAVGHTIQARATLRNDGEATARIDRARLVLSSSNVTSPERSETVSLPGSGSTTSLLFAVSAQSLGKSTISSLFLEATNLSSGDAAHLERNDAPSVTLTVQSSAQLTVERVRTSSEFVTRGQQGAEVSLTVVNPGDPSSGGAVVAIAADPVFDAPDGSFFAFPAPENATSLGAGQTTTLRWSVRVSTLAVPGSVAVTAKVLARDDNTLQPITVVNAATTSWKVQDPAALTLDSVSSPRARVRHGEVGVPLEVRVTGSAPASTGATAIDLTVTPRFNGTSTGYLLVPSDSNAVRLAAGQSTVLTFAVTVLEAAGRGVATLSAQAFARDSNSLQTVAVTGSPTTTWKVDLPGEVVVTRVTAGGSTVVGGQTTVPVSVELRNPGDRSVDFAAGIRIGTSSAGYLVTTSPANPTSLATGGTAILTFAVDVLPGAALGTTEIAAVVSATDPELGGPARVTNLVGSSWKVLTPASLQIVAVERTGLGVSVVRGQKDGTVTVKVANPGQSAVDGLEAVLEFNGSPDGYEVRRSPSNPVRIEGGKLASLLFHVDVPLDAPLGPTTLTANINGLDSHSRTVVTTSGTTPTAWTVLNPATLTVAELAGVPAAVNRGQTGIPVTVTVTNPASGPFEGGAIGLAASLRFGGSTDGFKVTPLTTPGPALDPGGSRELLFLVDVGETAKLGPTAVTVVVSGLDAVSGSAAAVSNSAVATWTVQQRARLEVSAVTLPVSRASTGQRELPVVVSLRNSVPATSGTTATELQVGLLFNGLSGGFIVAPVVVPPDRLAPGSSEEIEFTVDVLPDAPTGPISVTAKVNARDANEPGREVPVANAASARLTVQAAASLRLESLSAGSGTVTRGQQALPVTLGVRNTGETTAEGLLGELLFGGSPAGFTVTPDAGNPVRLGRGELGTLRFGVHVSDAAPAGRVLLTPRVSAFDSLSGEAITTTGAAKPAWDVQAPPSFTLLSIEPSRRGMLPGEPLSVTLTFRNDGGAEARVSSVSLVLDPPGVVGLAPVTLARNVAGGGADRVAVVHSGSAVSSGSSRIATARISATDANTGLEVPIGANLAAPGPLVTVSTGPVALIDVATPRFLLDRRPFVARFDASDSVTPDASPLTYTWSQTAGPSLALARTSTAVQEPAVSQAGRYELQLTVTDPLGLQAATSAELVVVANSSPQVAAGPFAALYAGHGAELTGLAVDADGDSLRYRWEQVSGPGPLDLEAGDERLASVRALPVATGTYVLRLTAFDGRDGTATTTEPLEVVAPLEFVLSLGRGPNLVSLLHSPFTSHGGEFGAADLVRELGGGTVVRTGLGTGPRTRFIPYIASLQSAFPLQAAEGYLVFVQGVKGPVRFSAKPWHEASGSRLVSPSVALVGYPRGVRAGETAAALVERSGAAYLVRTRVGEDGRSRFESFLPGLTPDFPLESGAAYLLGGLKSKRLLELPGER